MLYASRLLLCFGQSRFFMVAYFSEKPHDSYTTTDNFRSPDSSWTEEARSNEWLEMYSTTIELQMRTFHTQTQYQKKFDLKSRR